MCRSFCSNHDKTVILTAILLFDSAPAYKKTGIKCKQTEIFCKLLDLASVFVN